MRFHDKVYKLSDLIIQDLENPEIMPILETFGSTKRSTEKIENPFQLAYLRCNYVFSLYNYPYNLYDNFLEEHKKKHSDWMRFFKGEALSYRIFQLPILRRMRRLDNLVRHILWDKAQKEYSNFYGFNKRWEKFMEEREKEVQLYRKNIYEFFKLTAYSVNFSEEELDNINLNALRSRTSKDIYGVIKKLPSKLILSDEEMVKDLFYKLPKKYQERHFLEKYSKAEVVKNVLEWGIVRFDEEERIEEYTKAILNNELELDVEEGVYLTLFGVRKRDTMLNEFYKQGLNGKVRLRYTSNSFYTIIQTLISFCDTMLLKFGPHF